MATETITFGQPAEVEVEGDEVQAPAWSSYFSLDQLLAMADLSTADLSAILAGAAPTERLDIVRTLQAVRSENKAEREFEEQVTINRERKRARHEADRRDAEERAAYLTSSEGRSAAAAQFESEIIDLDDLPDPDPLIDGFLHKDSLVRTFGPPKSLKSFVTLDMAACISLGIEWHGHRTVQERVLYVVAEGARGVKKRRNAWNEHHGQEMKVIFYPKPVQIGEQDEMYRLISFCLTRQIGYIVFDTQARCTVGVDENDNTEMGEIIAALDILKQETKACVHLVHHSVGSDPKKARGATAWDGAVDAEFITKRQTDDSSQVEFVTKFQKDIGEADKLLLQTLEVGSSLVLEERAGSGGAGGGTGEVAPALVEEPMIPYLMALRSFHGPCTRSDLITDMKGTRGATAVKKAVNRLIAAGAVDENGSKLSVSQAGLVFLDRLPGGGVHGGDQATLWPPDRTPDRTP